MDSSAATFQDARLNHLREGMRKSFMERIEWLEGAGSLARTIRQRRFAAGLPVADSAGRIFWNEKDYLGIPQESHVSPG